MPRPIPRPTDKPVPPVDRSRLDAMLRGFMRNQEATAKAKEEGVTSTLADSLVARGVVPDSAGLRVGALAGDMVADPMNFVPGLGLVVGGLGDAGRLSAIVRKLNKTGSVEDFMTPRALQNKRPNEAYEGLYRPDAKNPNYDEVPPEPASPYTFGLVPTEKLAPLREFDRAAEPAGGVTGPDNIAKLLQHMAEGGKWSDPTAVAYYPDEKWAYLAEGNHRLALAEQLGLEQLPTTLWTSKGAPPMREYLGKNADGYDRWGPTGKKVGDLDLNQLAITPTDNYYVPPTMHPYLLKYFQQ